jgi:hypothetical protein
MNGLSQRCFKSSKTTLFLGSSNTNRDDPHYEVKELSTRVDSGVHHNSAHQTSKEARLPTYRRGKGTKAQPSRSDRERANSIALQKVLGVRYLIFILYIHTS